MQIDLRTVSIKPLRQTFDHIARRIGPDKAATRYQEGTLDVQATHNFHYRPTWDPDHEIFDASRRLQLKSSSPSAGRSTSSRITRLVRQNSS